MQKKVHNLQGQIWVTPAAGQGDEVKGHGLQTCMLRVPTGI